MRRMPPGPARDSSAQVSRRARSLTRRAPGCGASPVPRRPLARSVSTWHTYPARTTGPRRQASAYRSIESRSRVGPSGPGVRVSRAREGPKPAVQDLRRRAGEPPVTAVRVVVGEPALVQAGQEPFAPFLDQQQHALAAAGRGHTAGHRHVVRVADAHPARRLGARKVGGGALRDLAAAVPGWGPVGAEEVADLVAELRVIDDLVPGATERGLPRPRFECAGHRGR